MNNATFAGNIGQEPRINTINTASGQQSVLNFSLAVKKWQKDQQGNQLTLWVDCALWGARADALKNYLLKGSKVTVSGQVDVDSYDGKNGFVPKLTLNVSELTMMDSKNDNQVQQPQSQAPTQQSQPAKQHQAPQATGNGDFDSDIPF